MLKLLRLLPTDRMGWLWWPEFEKRVVTFLDTYGSQLDASQREQFVTELRNRFSTTPQLSGYWLILNGKDAFEQQAVGHICAWINVLYGRPYVMCYQTEIDVAWEGRETMVKCTQECGNWVADLNRQLAAKNERQIDYIEMYTMRDAEAWQRLLPELDWTRMMTVMRIGIPGRESANSKHLVQ